MRKYLNPPLTVMPLPNLVATQVASYQWFLEKGIKELLEEASPIEDFIGRDLELRFLDYSLDEPKFDEATARGRNLTYEAALRIKARLVNKKTDKKKDQEVYLGDIPLMTPRGTFIVNGVERVVIQQLIRSPGVFFTGTPRRGRFFYGVKVIPDRGAWLEFETDSNGVIWVRIDRKRKVAATSLLRAFGYGADKELLNLFKDVEKDPEIKFITQTIAKDTASTSQEGLQEVYRKIRPGDLATIDNAKSLIYNMFFNANRYDLGKVGRYKLNHRFSFKNVKTRVLRREDLVAIIREIVRLNVSQEEPDDIDHLANRRIRAVGELVQSRMRVGFMRMERIIKDRMSTLDIATVTPGQLISVRPIISVIREFFMSSQLSQFMDQINPLSELDHKRRTSAMGPGGLTRERAGFEVRDVHRTYYGRICPIATPEGPNTGLVGYLASYAKLNEYGFIETPYRKVLHQIENTAKFTLGKITGEAVYRPDKSRKLIAKKGQRIDKKLALYLEKFKKKGLKTIPIRPMVSRAIEWLDALEEEKYKINCATTPLDKEGYFVQDKVEARIHGQAGFISSEEIDYMDVSPQQIISVATSLIPFLEHDDGVRALMGTNMQRQAVPCINPQAPLVGTGVEARVARDSGHLIVAEEDGKIVGLTADEIKVRTKKGKFKTYHLQKFSRSNADTCFNQKIIVDKGQKVRAGDVLADGPAMSHGEAALGQNILVAFMSWRGGNYEDAILISSKLVENDRYSSIHIDNHVIDVRDTKLGPEAVTRDIPNVGEEKLKDLDEEGIIRVGAEVKSGDILVGKITPKGETELSAEEKLLRAIFGEKAKDVRDSSLYLEHGEHGKVVGVKIFSREHGDKLPAGVIKSIEVQVADIRKVQVGDKMAGRHGNKGVVSKIIPQEDMPFLADGTPIDIILNPLGVVSRMNLGQILETHLGLAAHKLGYKVACPALNGPKASLIKKELEEAGYSPSGKMKIYDGWTGLPFVEEVTVGYIYMMKLNHLVEDKVHQRSIGPYSLITQQPLGGKAQFGGQRFGEMEVWALEGYGAAHALQEMLTIKSDDVPGRTRAYESIIKGEEITGVNVPESFSVLVKELQGLGLDVELLKEGKPIKEISKLKSQNSKPNLRF